MLMECLFIHLTPLKVSSVERFDKKFRRGKVCSQWNIVYITEPDHIIYVRFVGLACKGIP